MSSLLNKPSIYTQVVRSQTSESSTPPDNVYQNAWINSFSKNHVPTTCAQKLFVLGASSVLSLLNTHRGDLVGVVGETLYSHPALTQSLYRLNASLEGKDILANKPRVLYAAAEHALRQQLGPEAAITPEMIVSHTLTDAEERAWIADLYAKPENTLGHQYAKYLVDHEYLPSHRYMVRFVDDPELAYVMQRYREVHDFLHVLTDLPPSVQGELALKALEFLQTQLPMNFMSVVAAAPAKLSLQENIALLSKGLPWARRVHGAITSQTQGTGVLGIYYERYWDEDIDVLRSKYGIFERCPL